MSLAHVLAETTSRVGARTALVTLDGRKVSYPELDAAASRVAAGLRDLGVEPGNRVAIAMQNIPEFAFAYFGILRAGAIVVPLNIMLTVPELERIVADCEPKFVLASESFLEPARAAAGPAEVISTDDWDRFGPPDRGASFPDPGDDEIAVLAYTSGTTGEPKGAMLSHGNLRANLDQQMQVPDSHVTEEDVLFLVLPLFHIFGLNVTLGQMALNGATGVLVDRFEPVPTLNALQEHRVTVLFGAPPMYSAWCATPGADQYDLSSIRFAISGAAPLPPDILREFRDIFGVEIFEGYGLTETAPTLASNRMAERPRPGSIGKPLPGIQLRLVDESGHDVELGDPGEIVVRGPNVFKGYWKRDDATEAVFRDGWFHTGDVAVRDEEGYLYLVDRKRDLILVSGFNVFPSEVEAALTADPAVAEAAVIGAPHPYTGETVKAFVVPERGSSPTEAQLLTNVEQRLARFKCPTSIEIVDALPHLLTGKVLRRALRT